MNRIYYFLFLLLLSNSNSFAQDENLFNSFTIPSQLKEKVNAVVRFDNIIIDIESYNKMIFKNKRIVTIFNEYGNSKHGAYFYYDNNIDIKKLEVKIYDAVGKEIKKIKKNDFQDVSAVDGSTLYSDSRRKYLEYTPISYPYTLHLDVEIEYNSTAFIPGWRPIEGFYVSTENAEFKISNTSNVGVKVKTLNFENYNIEKLSDFHFKAKNIKSLQPEAYSPDFKSYAPFLKAALTEFDMEGVKGINNNWKDFGKWMYDNLLSDTDQLPESVKTEIRKLTQSATNDIEKAKIVYDYMQNKTRYISVQVGIGGWKPMLAEDVDRLGYADCKGLTNYTKALLKEVGVESYYAVIYGDNNITNIDKDFSATEGNHVILCIPNDSDNIWLECTSQSNPFGFIAGFTDDRDALLIKPNGGEIVHTTTYKTEENLQLTKADIFINNNGDISANVEINSQGYQYTHHEGIQNLPKRDQELSLKEYWDYVNNLKIESIEIENNKEDIVFKEKVKLTAEKYAAKSGSRLLLQPNVFNRVNNTPTRYKERTLDFEIERGFIDIDEFIIQLDSNLEIEALPENVSLETKFGSYDISLEKISENKILYKRTHKLNNGYYPKEEYDLFRDFKLEVAKYDKSKMVLIIKS